MDLNVLKAIVFWIVFLVNAVMGGFVYHTAMLHCPDYLKGANIRSLMQESLCRFGMHCLVGGVLLCATISFTAQAAHLS